VIDLGDGMRMEAIKANGQFFQQIEGKWTKFAVNLDVAETRLLAQIRSGEVKLTDCKVLGTEVLEGMPVTVVSSRTEIEGTPPGSATLYVGQQDGLPYRQTAEDVTVTYRYKDIVAPNL
jgi:hypothetical protein